MERKFFNELFANIIQEHIKKIIYHNQVGFIPEMQGWFMKCKLVNIIFHINKLEIKTI